MPFRFDMNSGEIELGRYRGAPIVLSPFFFFTAAVLSYPFWRTFNGRGLALAVCFAFVLFASILIHELVHAVMGTRYRVPVDGITIHLWGGVVHFRWRPHRAWQDFAITAAGPLSNLAIGLAAFALMKLVPAGELKTIVIMGKVVPAPYQPPTFLEALLFATAVLNIGLCLMNLLPAFPLDGGRLLYLALASRFTTRTAALVVGGLGTLCAVASGFLFIGSMLAGFPVLMPISLTLNWEVARSAWSGSTGWKAIVA